MSNKCNQHSIKTKLCFLCFTDTFSTQFLTNSTQFPLAKKDLKMDQVDYPLTQIGWWVWWWYYVPRQFTCKVSLTHAVWECWSCTTFSWAHSIYQISRLRCRANDVSSIPDDQRSYKNGNVPSPFLCIQGNCKSDVCAKGIWP